MPWSESIGHNSHKSNAGTALYMLIAEEIERNVRSGVLLHGDRIPSTDIIARQFNVTVPTAQHGLSLLMERGMLKRRPRHGTTIDSSGTSRCVCVAFGVNPFTVESEYDRLFMKWLDLAFRKRGIAVDCRLSLGGSDAKANISRLAEDADNGRFACLLPLHATLDLMNWLMARRNLRWTWPAHFDIKAGAFDALDHLLSKGFRRIASVSMFPPDYYPEPAINQEFEGVLEAYRKHGVAAPAPSLLYWGKTEADGYEGVKRVFSDKGSRPEALFVNHDVLSKGALRALAELGISIPQDLAFATHSNKGDAYPWPKGAVRVECDPADAAEATAEHIDKNFLSGKPGDSMDSPTVKSRIIIEESGRP